MRQAQQNRRGRGRNNNNNNNNNNRKGQNPLTRSFESNGPDVKIRGTPSHIAEKYVAMARDALSSGDPVLAENYLQHAEHYNRIIMTHREAQAPQHGEHGQSNQGANGHQAIGRHRNPGDPIDDEPFGDDDDAIDVPVRRGGEPQPNMRANDRDDRGPRRNQQRRDRGPDRGQERDRSAVPDRERGQDRDRAAGDRDRNERAPERVVERDGDADRGAPRDRAMEGEQPSAGRAGGRGGRRERYAQSDDQPEFLKRPVRRPRAAAPDDEDDGDARPARPPKSDEAAE